MTKVLVKQNESEWQNKIRQSGLILHSIAEGICVVDKNGEITFSNFAADEMLGGQAADLHGKSYDEILLRREKEALNFCPIRFALTEGETTHVNTETFFRFDGSDFLVEYICVPLVENDEIIGAVITFEDITERRDIERAVAQARDSALDNARARAAFLANVSHEIRTPLNGIIGMTGLLSETNLDEKQRNYLAMLKISTAHLLETVNDILDFSKIEAGKLILESVEFNVQQLIEETANLYANLAAEKKLGFDMKMGEHIPSKIYGDGSRLRQVLNNLLSNAVKFTETGEISLEISSRQKNEDLLTMIFCVSDTGIGIDEKKSGDLFEPFTQADVSTSRRFGGTGLGLAICREIVEKMRGEIGAESRSGKGSRFWFTAEFLIDDPKKDDESESQKSFKNVSEKLRHQQNLNSEHQTFSILIAEDNLINLEITRELLKQIGFEPKVAENGAEALSKCSETDFDLVLMDCQMPEMDGFEAAEKILGRTQTSEKPKIIALTANASEAERKKCFDAGMVDFLSKPLDKNALIEALNKHFFAAAPLEILDLSGDFIQHSLSEIISPETLKKLLEIEARGKKDFVAEMVGLYIDYTENGLSEIETAFAVGDYDKIVRRAHGLKGSSANIGAMEMMEMFEQLEENAQRNDRRKIEQIFNQLNDKFASIKKILYRNL